MVHEGRIDSEEGVTRVPFLVTPRKLEVENSSIYELVNASR